jgi:hypothetical protein
MVMIVAGAVPQRAPHHSPTNADSAGMADVVMAETSASSPSLPVIAQPPSANQLNVTGQTFSEPLLLLLMGTLLIAVGTSIRRLTKSNRPTHAAVPRRT